MGETRCFNEYVLLVISELAVSAGYDGIEVQRQAGEWVRVSRVEVGRDKSWLRAAAGVLTRVSKLGLLGESAAD